MDDAKWERFAALGGFVFVVLTAIGGFLPGTPPAPDDSAQKIAAFFHDHAGAIQANQVLSGLGVIGLAWWFGSLFRRMRAAEGGNPRLSVVAIAGFALGGSMALLSGAVASTVALRLNDMGPQFARAMYGLSMIAIASSAFGVVAFLSAICALNLRTRMFPLWTNYVGWLAAAGFLVGGFGAGSDSGALASVGFVAYLVWCVWILAVSAFMWRGERAPA